MTNILTIIICIPLIGFIVLPFLRGKKAGIAAFIISLINLIIAATLLCSFKADAGGFQFIENYSIIPNLGIGYRLGIDGISLVLILLTAFLTPLVILSSFRTIDKHSSGYYMNMLLLETGVIGAFAALDLILFYVFWEIMLIPMFFIIGIWGGTDRIYATIKFVLFTMIGSLLMLVAILYLGAAVGSFDYLELLQKPLTGEASYWVFGAFALAFLIKVPIFPLHTWLPDAHTEAPAGGSVILAGVLLKLGTYGLLRFNLPLFPDVAYDLSSLMVVLAVIGIIHGAMAAAVQPDMKRLIAYSSVSHMGFIVLGIFSLTAGGLEGSVIQMLNHGISTGALFFLVGMVYDRTHTRLISDYGGIAKVVPVFAALFMISTLASAGLPGLNGFVGEYVILVSSFASKPYLTSVAVLGVILGAWYLLKLYGKVFFGPVSEKVKNKLDDINLRELVVIIPLIVLMFIIGFYPSPLFKLVKKSVATNINMYLQKANNKEFINPVTALKRKPVETEDEIKQGEVDTDE